MSRMNHNRRMRTLPFARWWLWLVTFLAAALAAASAGYWGLKLLVPPPTAARPAVMTNAQVPVDSQLVARVLGGGRSPAASQSAPMPEATAGRFKLAGVVADKHARGYALIAVDGQPARPFRVGSPVGDALVLQSVSKAGAVLGSSLNGPMAVRLEMPKLGPP